MSTSSERATALYCRLSDDDILKGDSYSIENQKKILMNFAEENNLPNPRFYVDDGFTGTNFNRPDFKRMIEDVKSGIIKTIVVKDMSRFGRDRLWTGIYNEIIFPQHGVHCIGVEDGRDNEVENDLAPFQDIFNEWHPKETSKKVKAVKRTAFLL